MPHEEALMPGRKVLARKVQKSGSALRVAGAAFSEFSEEGGTKYVRYYRNRWKTVQGFRR